MEWRPPLSREERRRRRRKVIRRRRVAVVTAAVVVVAAIGYLVTRPSGHRPDAARVSRTAVRHDVRRHLVSTTAATFPGPDGVESSAIIAQNDKPGTTAWKITSEPRTGMIEGFADRTSVTQGQAFRLYVSTTAPSFRVLAYRMGYYHGAGGRQVWASASLPGIRQPPCPVDRSTNMVSCDNWTPSTTITVTGAWPVGDYLLKLVGSGGQQSYVLLTVWDPASHATYMVVNRTLTEAGWNTWGGYDYYQGEGPCILDNDSYPPCNRARVVSFDRPQGVDYGASDFLGSEYPLIYWMEEHGLDVTYVTDVTLSVDPQFALQHKAWLSLDHDETWTWPELQGARQALARGVNILFFSGAAIVRHSRLQASPLGPDQEEVDYRNPAEDPASASGNPDEVTSNQWSPVDSALTGEEYSGYVLPGEPQAPLVVYDASSWLYKGTGLHDGSQIPDVIGSDIDHLDEASGLTPADLQVLAHSPVPLSEAYTNQGAWGGDTYSDFAYYTDPTSGGGVIDTGDTTFIGDLEPCAATTRCAEPVLSIMVGNMLRLFGRGPAGHFEAPVANWRSLQPYGS